VLFVGYGQDVDSVQVATDTIRTPNLDQSIDSTAVAAVPETDTTEIKEPKRFLTPSILLDYGKLLTYPLDFETKYEGGIELLFLERFALIGEFGTALLEPEEAYTNSIYESSGTYYRVGLGYVGPKDPEHNIGFYLRYGSATFDESIRVLIDSPTGVQDDPEVNFERTSLTANWWELALYTDKKLFKNSELLWIGLNLRFRILQSYDRQDVVDVYSIPGYGRSFDKTIPAANFFLRVRF